MSQFYEKINMESINKKFFCYGEDHRSMDYLCFNLLLKKHCPEKYRNDLSQDETLDLCIKNLNFFDIDFNFLGKELYLSFFAEFKKSSLLTYIYHKYHKYRSTAIFEKIIDLASDDDYDDRYRCGPLCKLLWELNRFDTVYEIINKICSSRKLNHDMAKKINIMVHQLEKESDDKIYKDLGENSEENSDESESD